LTRRVPSSQAGGASSKSEQRIGHHERKAKSDNYAKVSCGCRENSKGTVKRS